MRLILLAAVAALSGISAPAVAAGFADPAEIDRAVAQFTGADTGALGGARAPVDRRLRLAGCNLPLKLEWYGRAQDTVLVRCPDAGGWRLFVPVEAEPAPAKAVDVVSRGDSVSIAVRGSGFTLTRQGEALESGAVGDWIRVRPAGTRSDPVRVRVLQPGKVGMEMP